MPKFPTRARFACAESFVRILPEHGGGGVGVVPHGRDTGWPTLFTGQAGARVACGFLDESKRDPRKGNTQQRTDHGQLGNCTAGDRAVALSSLNSRPPHPCLRPPHPTDRWERS